MKIVKTVTSDGLHLKGLITTPTENSNKIIIHIHGMSGSPLLNEYYQNMHDCFAMEGVSFLAVEHRGSGMITNFESETGSQIIGNSLERFEECLFDVQAWVDFAKNEGYTDIWLQGHSLGTSKVAYYVASDKSNDVKGVILLSPSDMMGLVNDEEGLKDHKIMLPEAMRMVSQGRGDQLIEHRLWGAEVLSANTYLNLFGETAKTAIFNFGNESLGWETVRAINLPVIAITGTKDDGIVPVIDPHKAMDKLESELVSSPLVKTFVYEGAEHGFEGFGKKIVADVIGFITSIDS